MPATPSDETDVPRQDAEGADGEEEPYEEGLCREYWYFGKCRYSKRGPPGSGGRQGKCQFNHVRGRRHWC